MILGLLLHAIRPQEPTYFPDAWLERQGYQRASASRSKDRVDALYRNQSALSQVSIVIHPLDKRQARAFEVQEEIGRGESFPLTQFHRGVPSGIPLGTDLRYLAPTPWKDVRLKFRTEWVHGTISATWGAPVGKDFVIPEHAVAFAEELARQVVARIEARRFNLSARRALGTGMVSLGSTSDTELVDLVDWAKARGWALQKDDTMATLTKGERKLRVPLGALAVEVDGKWRDLPEVVMLSEERWWVPLDALEAAAQ